MENMQVVEGPIVEVESGLIYQVTLASGMIVTSPWGFAASVGASEQRSKSVVSETGRVLAHQPSGDPPTSAI